MMNQEETLQRYRGIRTSENCFGTEQLKNPHGICSTASDDIVVADCGNKRIQIFDVNGQVKGSIGSEGCTEYQFDDVVDVSVTSWGWIVASDQLSNQIRMFGRGNRALLQGGLIGPYGVATTADGRIYVCDRKRHQVKVFWEEVEFTRKFDGEFELKGLKDPKYISVTSNGRVIVSDGNHSVHVFDSNDGRHLSQVGSEGTSESQFKFPAGVATDEHGNIIVADMGNNRVQIFKSNGDFVTSFGSEGPDPLKLPEGVCVLSDGRIAVTDRGNHRVQIF